MKRAYNFNAGPSAMPLEVLLEAQEEFLNYANTGMSIIEMRHLFWMKNTIFVP